MPKSILLLIRITAISVKLQVKVISDPSEHLASIICINLFSVTIKVFVSEFDSDCSINAEGYACMQVRLHAPYYGFNIPYMFCFSITFLIFFLSFLDLYG